MTLPRACAAPCESDPDLHFDYKRAPEAARMCRACPAREACLALALDMESGQGPTGRYGVWGGLTPAERAAFAGVSAGVVEWCEVCGTFARRGAEHDVACERRRAVAGLLGAHGEREIARRLGVSLGSVQFDIKAIRRGQAASQASPAATPAGTAANQPEKKETA